MIETKTYLKYKKVLGCTAAIGWTLKKKIVDKEEVHIKNPFTYFGLRLTYLPPLLLSLLYIYAIINIAYIS